MPLPQTPLHPNLAALYQVSNTARPFQCLLIGKSGNGKTASLRTVRKPALIDSFDPNGAEGHLLQPYYADKTMFRRYFTAEGAGNYSAWERAFDQDKAAGMFSSLGTYCIDSLTLMVEAAGAPLQKIKDGKLQPLELQSYNEILVRIKSRLKQVLTLPCDVIVCAHIDIQKDEVTGRMETSVAAFKSMAAYIPLLFNDMWICKPAATPQGMKYQFHTESDGTYTAKTGMKLPAVIPADFEGAFKLAGRGE